MRTGSAWRGHGQRSLSSALATQTPNRETTQTTPPPPKLGPTTHPMPKSRRTSA